MNDKTEPLSDDNVTKNIDIDAKSNPQKMFDETFSRLMNEFGKACEAEGVEIAVAIAQHPMIDRPIVFIRAPHIVEAGALMASLLREIKSDVAASLDTELQSQ